MKWPWPRSLFGRHLLLIVGLILLAELALALGFHVLVQQPRQERALNQTRNFVELSEQALVQMEAPQRQRWVQALQASTPGLSLTPDPPHIQPGATPLFDRWWRPRLQAQLGRDVLLVRPPGETPRLWVHLQAGADRWWLGLDAQPLLLERSGLWLGVLLLTTTLAVLGAVWIQRPLKRSLHPLQQAAAQVAQGHYPQVALPPQAPQELQALAEAFDHMAQQLQAADSDRALMLAGLSHDLRTPLAKMRLAVELLPDADTDELIRGLVRNIAVADQIVERFIDFARTEDPEPEVPCSVEELVRDVVAATCASDRVQWQPPPTELPLLLCRPLALRRVLLNLLDNALKYSPGLVQVSWWQSGSEWVLQVQDQGAGIPEELLTRVTQPFVRGDRGRGGPAGAGLGLAIVDRLVRSMGGRWSLHNHNGLQVQVTLGILLMQGVDE